MCRDCGCGVHEGSGRPTEDGHAHAHEHHGHDHGDQDHRHEHHHQHHDHDHDHHSHPASSRILEVKQTILEKNDRQAERNRGYFRGRGWLVLNVISSPGSGKTTLLQETVSRLNGRLKTGIIVGDLATDNDARRLRQAGGPVVQITTGTVCHLEAEMLARALKGLDSHGLELLIIENVGNLVCPASYDLGEDLKIVLISVTEGEDKPQKYPPIFQSADVVVISKMDIAEAVGFQRELLRENIRRLAPRATVFEISSKTGQGMEPWLEFLIKKQEQVRVRDPLPF